MDNDDVTVIVVMNGINAIAGTEQHTMRNFIEAKKRQLALTAGDDEGVDAKRPRVPA